MRNVYEQNQTGVNLFAGLDAAGVGGAAVGGNGNSIAFTSIEDGIFDNLETDNLGRLGAGVLAAAGVRTSASAPPSSDNQLILQFVHTSWSGNFQGESRRDLVVYGAVALGGSVGTNNTARVLIRKASSDGAADAFQFIDSQPSDATDTNRVTIVGSDVAITHANTGIDPLPEWHFANDID